MLTTVKDQKALLAQAFKNSAHVDEDFLFLLSCEDNPLTAADLERNIQRRPSLWERYSGFLGYLRGREASDGWQ